MSITQSPSTVLGARQLWGLPTTPSETALHCTPLTLPSQGIIALPDTTYTLTADAVFTPFCSGEDFSMSADGSPGATANFRDPFYASVTPQVYVIAATTVIAWILVLMLIITPRTTFFGASAAQPSFRQGHGIIGGAHGGSTSIIGVGSRPWLQKIAALTVAISLTIATADTFQVAMDQYEIGYMDATAMKTAVIGSTEIKVTRVISDVFVWLAQVQTLIRLFPRHKEKVLIKWIGFALIICDTIFSCLNSFLVGSSAAPRYFVNAIPALSYLFELALGLLYAAWVIYYALTKRRYAFYHTKMRSISLISLLSLVAVLTPVVFFITDVSNPEVAVWGDYFRWVGAAAASVVVWEWVERIEALEREEKKDGILGREVYDDDDMFGDAPGESVAWDASRRTPRQTWNFHNGSGAVHANGMVESGLQSSTTGALRVNTPDNAESPVLVQNEPSNWTRGPLRRKQRTRPSGGMMPPRPVASPISRTNTSSATSTLYIVRPDPSAGVTQPVRRRPELNVVVSNREEAEVEEKDDIDEKAAMLNEDISEQIPDSRHGHDRWISVTNPFKRKRASPPAEVRNAQQQQAGLSANDMARAATPKHNFSRWDIKNRFGVLAGEAGDSFRQRIGRGDGRSQQAADRVIVIPAQPRGSGRTWSPAILETGHSENNSQVRHDSDATGSSSEPVDVQHDELGRSTAVRHFDVQSQERLASSTPDQSRPPPGTLSRTGSAPHGTVIMPAPRRSPANASIREEG